jgi:membrane protein YdbS with pleckstrin-like domain
MSNDQTTPPDDLRDPVRPVDTPAEGTTEPALLAESAIGGDGAEVAAAAETELWIGRTRWKHYAGRLVLWLAANVLLAVLVAWIASRANWLTATGAFWIVVLVFAATGLLVVGSVALTILSHRYRLTSQRLFLQQGILWQTVDQTELIRVDDVRLEKNIADRLFGLGSVVILSTDVSNRETRIPGVAEPEMVAEAIRGHMRAMRKKSLFVESL